jgi:hypothetical protein
MVDVSSPRRRPSTNQKRRQRLDGRYVGCEAGQGWNALTVGADNLGIHDRGYIESRRFLHDKRIAIAPIISIDRVEPRDRLGHEFAADSRRVSAHAPARSRWGLLGDDWLTRMNGSGASSFERLPREHNMPPI